MEQAIRECNLLIQENYMTVAEAKRLLKRLCQERRVTNG